jgi:hypothetical protein
MPETFDRLDYMVMPVSPERYRPVERVDPRIMAAMLYFNPDLSLGKISNDRH